MCKHSVRKPYFCTSKETQRKFAFRLYIKEVVFPLFPQYFLKELENIFFLFLPSIDVRAGGAKGTAASPRSPTPPATEITCFSGRTLKIRETTLEGKNYKIMLLV